MAGFVRCCTEGLDLSGVGTAGPALLNSVTATSQLSATVRSLCGVLRGMLSSRRLRRSDMTSFLIECRGCYSPSVPLNTGNGIWAARAVTRLRRGHEWICRAVGRPDLPVLQSRAINANGRQTLKCRATSTREEGLSFLPCTLWQ